MIKAAAQMRRKAGARRNAVVVAGSFVLHALILLPLGFGLFTPERVDPPAPPQPTIYVELEPRPLLEGEKSRQPVPAPSRAAVETRPETGPTASVVAPRRKLDEEDKPSTPSPRAAVGAPSASTGAAAPAGADNPWTVRQETMAAAVARSMRTGTGGCRIMDATLTKAEQDLCDERFNAGAAEAARRHGLGPRTLTPSEARRQGQFAAEGEAALRRYEARRAPLGSGVGVMGASPECVGGNLRGTCAGAYLKPEYQRPEEAPFRRSSGPQ